MKALNYCYEVKAAVEITGRDLFVLRLCSESHYDSLCQRAFRPPGIESDFDSKNFGHGWIMELLWKAEKEFECEQPLEGCFGLSVEVMVTSRQVGTLLKILEMAPLHPNLREEGRKLFEDFHRIFTGMMTESSRLNEPQEVQDRTRRTTLKISGPMV